eukprot:scaffold8234_cov248-Pinguiococcus_pyrenoidosus.AAC.3
MMQERRRYHSGITYRNAYPIFRAVALGPTVFRHGVRRSLAEFHFSNGAPRVAEDLGRTLACPPRNLEEAYRAVPNPRTLVVLCGRRTYVRPGVVVAEVIQLEVIRAKRPARRHTIGARVERGTAHRATQDPPAVLRIDLCKRKLHVYCGSAVLRHIWHRHVALSAALWRRLV